MQHPEYRLGRVCHSCLPYVSCLWTLYCEFRSFLLAFDEGLRHLLLNSTKRSNCILWWSMYIDCHSNQNKGLSTNRWNTGLNHFSISIVPFHICIIFLDSNALFIHRNHPVHSLSLNTFRFRI